MVDLAATVFRDFETDGVPASGKHNPQKAKIREWGAYLESILGAAQAGAVVFASKATLDATLTYAANTMAWVVGDVAVGNNGIYRKLLGSGLGSWSRVSDLPFSFIKAISTGAGLANAIDATTSVPIPAADGGALISLPVMATNTASPVTVAFNGGAALTIKTNSGNDVAPGGIVAGMIVAGYVSGSTFRLLSDQVSAAIVAAVEALLADMLVRYLGSRVDNAAATAAAGGSPTQGTLYWNTTDSEMRVFDGGSWQSFAGGVANGSIGTAKLADEAVTREKIAGGAVGEAELDPAVVSNMTPAGFLFGLTLSNNVADANNDINIASGSCRDIANTVSMALGASLTKRLDAAWSVGTDSGGLDTGSKAVSTSYHVWLIRRPDTGVVDALFSTSATNPAMPSGYTQKRRVGAILTDGSGNIRAFVQAGGWFMLKSALNLSFGNISGNAPLLKSAGAPTGLKICARISIATTGSSAGYVAVTDPDLGAPVATENLSFYQPASVAAGAKVDVWTNTAGQVYAIAGGTSTITSSTYLQGWYDIRDTSV